MRPRDMVSASFGTGAATARAGDLREAPLRREGAGAPDPGVRRLIDLVKAEYAEMPGLCVTPVQAARLWAIDRETCDEVFDHLIAMGLVKRTRRGTLVRT